MTTAMTTPMTGRPHCTACPIVPIALKETPWPNTITKRCAPRFVTS